MHLRILLFHPWIKSKGGAEKLILEYAKRSKHDITILTWVYDQKRTFEEFKELDVVSIFPHFFDDLARTFLFRGVFFGLLAARRKIPIDPKDYDVLLISSSGIAELLLLYNKHFLTEEWIRVMYCHTPLRASYLPDTWFGFKYRFVSKIRGILAKEYYKAGIFMYNRMEKEAWKYLHAVVFNSQLSMKRAIDKSLVHKRMKTTIIYPGVDIDYIQPGEPHDYFLYVGRFGVAKRQWVLLKAWKKFVKKYPRYKLVLAGGTENKKYLKRIVRMARGLPNVYILLQKPFRTIIKLYQNSLCFVHIPFMEDFGIAPFEAAAAGKFIINVYPSGNYELLKDAPGIYWIKEKYDDNKMAETIYKAMVDFVEHQEEYIKLGEKNREFIERLGLSWDRFAKELDEFIETIYLR